uniref:C2H2-type domain-containing protein n=1 Tax=Parastrongyloides trichosuri TaxID=131310 RepID=A0A0N4ZAU5_PARTI
MAAINKNDGESLQFILQISIKNPLLFPFRLIGDKANGVFVTCLTDETTKLKNGDIFLYCEHIKLSGLSCNQVYSVIKYFSMRNNGNISVVIWRNKNKNFESRMKRHWTVNEGLNLVNTKFVNQDECKYDKDEEMVDNDLLNSNQPIKNMNEIEDRKEHDEFTKKHIKMHNYVVVFDEAKCKTTSLLQSKKKYFSDLINKAYYQQNALWICPTCKYHVRSRRLHTIKHDWISSAKRLLPHSASNFFELQRFNDEEDDGEVDEDNLSCGEYSSLL